LTTHTYKTAAIVTATVTSFLTPFMGSAITVALPTIGRDLNMGTVALSWVALSFSLATAVFLVPFARLADIHGRRRFCLYGTLLFTVATALAGAAPTASVLLGSRVLQGIGSAMIFGTAVAILTLVFPPAERGRALGFNVAAVYVGLSIGPFVGGVLVQQLGWRSIFWATVPLGLVAVATIVWGLRAEWAEARGEAFDWPGSLLYAAALLALMLGFSRLLTPMGTVLLVAGLLGMAGFVALEMRVGHPVFDVRLFARNKVFAFSNLAALINYSATAAVGFLLSLYLQYIKGLSPQQAGVVLLSQPVIQALFSPLAGWLSERIEPRVVASAGMALNALGLFLFALVGARTPTAVIVAQLMLLGFGFALFSSPNMNAIMGSVERRLYGVASGSLATVRLVGQTFSLALATLILALNVGPTQITEPLYPAFITACRTTFALLGILCVFGVFASLTRGKLHEKR
jgi:EmrB/QacA subfamily drug resistance transporter